MKRKHTPPQAVTTDTWRRLYEEVYRDWGRRCREARGTTTLRAAVERINRTVVTDGTPAITFQTLHDIEQGRIAPREHTKAMIAFAFGKNVADLFPVPSRREMERRLSA